MRDLERSARIDEVGHTDRHAGGTGQDKLGRIFASHDTADAVDGDIDGLGNLPDHAHGDVMTQRARKTALGLCHAGLAGMDVDGHALDGVDDRKAVGAGGLEGLGDLGDVDRRHLHEQRLIGHLAAGSHNGRGALGRGAHGGTAGGRTVTINAAAVCMSGIQLAALRDRLNALACQPLTLTIEDAHGIRSADCWLADDTDPIPLPTEQAAAFTLVLYCPDPLKYGPPITYPASGGVIRIRNEGNAPTWPSIAVTGRATSLRLTLGDGEVRWQGDADGLTLDFRDMIPSAGNVTKDLAFRIPPGASTVTAAVDAGATVSMTVRPAWR